MNVQKITKEVYVTADGVEHLTLEAAQEHYAQQKRAAIIEWLSNKIEDAGGPYHDFSVEKATDWVIDNLDEIVRKCNDG